MATRRYADLPDVDNAPDVYETPELTDDASTLKTSGTLRSSSLSPSESSDTDRNGLDRTRLQLNHARARFLSSRVDAREADFSDRLNERRQTYKTTTRVRRRDGATIQIEDEDDGVWSDEDARESLSRKLARLTREIEEVRVECAQVEPLGAATTEDKAHDSQMAIEMLSKALDGVRASQRDAVSAHRRLAAQLSEPGPTRRTETTSGPTQPVHAFSSSDEQILTRVADFDTRLTELEHSLGLSTLDPSNNTITPLLSTITHLDDQIALLSSSDTQPHLEVLAGSASAATATATKHAPALTDPSIAAEQEDATVMLSRDDLAQLHDLYTLLPRLTGQSQAVPLLLSRLGSLQHVHANAEVAAGLLTELEARVRNNNEEISAWRAGLQKLEEVVGQAEEGMRVNVETVEGWVRELEDRVKVRESREA